MMRWLTATFSFCTHVSRQWCEIEIHNQSVVRSRKLLLIGLQVDEFM